MKSKENKRSKCRFLKNEWTLIIFANLVKSQNLLTAQSLIKTHMWIFSKNEWTLIILVNLVKSQNLFKAQSLIRTHMWIFKRWMDFDNFSQFGQKSCWFFKYKCNCLSIWHAWVVEGVYKKIAFCVIYHKFLLFII